MKNKNIVVTGGAGFIGSNLAKRLIELGNNVAIIDNFSTGSMENLNDCKGACFIEANVCNYPVIKRWFEGMDIVFHMAAIPSVPKSIETPMKTNEANISGTLSVLEAARNTSIKRVIFSSSAAVYGNKSGDKRIEWESLEPISPYGLTKWVGEQYCSMYNKLFGLNTTILRYFNVFGERQSQTSEYAAVIPKFIKAMLKGESPTIYGDGEQTRDFTHVRNIVDANILAAESNIEQTEAYNIATGCSISVNDLVYKLNKLLDTNIKAKYLPEKPGDIKYSEASIEHAQRRLDYTPKTSISEGLERTINWYLRQPEVKGEIL